MKFQLFTIIFIIALSLGCKPKHKAISKKQLNSNCSTEQLELYAQNYRRSFAKDSKLLLADLNELIAPSIDTIIDKDVKEVLNKFQLQNEMYKFQNPLIAGWIKASKSNVEEFIKIEDDRKPIISTKPAFSPNAEVIKSPNSDCDRRIIFINEGVTLNFYQIPRTLLSLISEEILVEPGFSYDKQDEYFLNNIEKIFQEVAALWTLDFTEGSLDNKAIIWHYVSSVYHFLIAHEYAHDILNHKGNLNAYSMKIEGSSQILKVNEVAYEWAQELEADFYATNILLQIGESKNLGLPLPHLFIWGGEYFCTFLDYHTFSENYSSVEGQLQMQISELDSILKSNPNKIELKQEKTEALIKLYKKLIGGMKVLANEELPKVEYRNLDSLVTAINNWLPNNPTTEDFQRMLLEFKLIPSTNKLSHPPTYIRRALCRVSILKNSKISSLVTGGKNHGDLYWFNLSKTYRFLRASLNEVEVDENLINSLKEK